MESIEKGDDDAGLKSLIDLAESTPKFLRPQLDQLISACIEVYKSTNQVNWKGLFIFETLYDLLIFYFLGGFLETFSPWGCSYFMWNRTRNG